MAYVSRECSRSVLRLAADDLALAYRGTVTAEPDNEGPRNDYNWKMQDPKTDRPVHIERWK